jgi:hypothetical protein
MADDPKPPSQPPPPSPPPQRPSLYEIPASLVEKWSSIADHERVQASVTKQDVDHLILGLLRASDAQTALQDTLVHWSNGRVEDANRTLADFHRLNADSQNRIRQFATGLMFAAVQGRKDAT